MFGAAKETRESAAAPLPHDAATLYPEDDGFLGKRAKKGRAKLLSGVDELLRRALAPGETIRYAARAVRYGVLEFIFSGNAARYHNTVALVVTDRRVLMVHLTSRGKAADIKNQIPLSELRRAGKVTLSGWCLQLADGTRQAFVAISGKDRKRMEELLNGAIGGAGAPEGARPPGRPSLEPLCPACLQPVPGAVGATLTCPNPMCRIPFRDPKRAARLSAVVPGLGDLYLRHHLFGALEFLGSMLMLGIGVMFVADAIADPAPSKLTTAAVIFLFFLAGPRVVDYFVTLHMGRKGLVPLALAPAPGAQARNLPSFPRWSPLLFVGGLALAGVVVFGLGQDLQRDGAVREASRLAAAGKLDEARARWDALVAAGAGSDERKVRFALALMEAGDLMGMDAIRATFGADAKVEEKLADRWNAALAAEQAALVDYDVGVDAFVKGEEKGLAQLDRALAYFARVKRPHLPATRAELSAHLAAQSLAPPLEPDGAEAAEHWVSGATGAPAAELAVLQGAIAAARGDRAALTLLASAVVADAPPEFRLLALESRLGLATTEAERDEVRKAAAAMHRPGLTEDLLERLGAIVGPRR
jgi:hypothetical protein